MKAIAPYLNFNGNCREAMTFYKKCFNAELQMMTFRDSKMDVPADFQERIMHACVTKDDRSLLASDTLPHMTCTTGTNFHVAVTCDSIQEAENYFKAFSEGAKITMPLQETFWAVRFGMLTDKFGVNWMFNLNK